MIAVDYIEAVVKTFGYLLGASDLASFSWKLSFHVLLEVWQLTVDENGVERDNRYASAHTNALFSHKRRGRGGNFEVTRIKQRNRNARFCAKLSLTRRMWVVAWMKMGNFVWQKAVQRGRWRFNFLTLSKAIQWPRRILLEIRWRSRGVFSFNAFYLVTSGSRQWFASLRQASKWVSVVNSLNAIPECNFVGHFVVFPDEQEAFARIYCESGHKSSHIQRHRREQVNTFFECTCKDCCMQQRERVHAQVSLLKNSNSQYGTCFK